MFIWMVSWRQKNVDAYSGSLDAQKVLFEKTGLGEGSHTIKVLVDGGQNPSAEGAHVTIDAFELA